MTLRITTDKPLERIGAGHCGSVWDTLRPSNSDRMPIALKREDGGPGRSLRNEYSVQSQVSVQFPNCRESSVLVPPCLDFIESEDPRWNDLLPRFPRGYQPCNTMVSEKIEPVCAASRRLLVKNYCPEPIRGQILQSRENEHCLVRIYLGRRRLDQQENQHRRQRILFFSLRNFPLHIDQAEELKLPYEDYAIKMAEALATLHWQIGTDGADIEFVLGAPRRTDTSANEGAKPTSQSPLTNQVLWMLDFDCCRPVQRNTQQGLEAMARAFWRNDPYYPRPGSGNMRDQQLWDVFATEYRRVGHQIAHDRTPDLTPEEVEETCAMVDKVITTIEATKGKW